MGEIDIFGMGLKEVYSLITAATTAIDTSEREGREAKREAEERIRKIRFGYTIYFDIYNYFKGNYKDRAGIIAIERKRIRSSAFYTELEKREAEAKVLAAELTGQADIFTGWRK